MIELRITKYSPHDRDESGAYLIDDWTSASDIGHKFGNHVLTAESYLEVEDQYVRSVLSLMKAAEVATLKATDIEVHEGEVALPDKVAESALETISTSTFLTVPEVKLIIQASLREVLWCKLGGNNGFYVHFGHDYYMYAGFDDGRIDQVQIPRLLFWEPFRSPYRC